MQMKRSIIFPLIFTVFMVFFNATGVWGAVEPATCSGQVYGADGKPPVLADIHVTEIGETYQNSVTTAQTDRLGRFQVKLKGPAFYMLWISAPNHEQTAFPVYISYSDTKVELNITLNPYTYKEKFKEVKIIGDWNKFNLKNAAVMQRKVNGTYVYELETTVDTISYQLLGVVDDKRPVNGTMADSFIEAENGDYRSVLKVKPGKVKIVFEPAKLYKPKNKKIPQLNFDEGHQSLGNLFEIQNRFNQVYNEYQAAMEQYREAHGDTVDFKYDYSKLQSYLEDDFQNGKETYIKEFAAINLIQMSKMGLLLDSERDLEILKVIPPGSELWGIDPNLIVRVSLEFNKDASDYMLWYFTMQNPSRRVQARALATLATQYFDAGDKEKAQSIYQELDKNYPDIKEIRDVLLRINPDKRIQTGKMVPEFEAVLLGSDTVVSNKTMLGKYYLIDFWASWCGNCMKEMPYINSAYDKFRDQDFEILSLSLDKAPEDVTQFRSERWPMPWLHVFLEDGWDSEIVYNFETQNIPRLILIGPDGKILAYGEELRGEQLDRTLTACLEKKEDQ